MLVIRWQWGGACYIQLHACTRSRYCAHTSLLLLTHHSHPGRQCCIFVTTPSLSNRPVYWAHTCGKVRSAFGGPLVLTQGHLHWSQQLHPHISADVHTSLTPREALTHFFHTTPFPFSRPVLYVQGHALVVKMGSAFFGGHLCTYRDTCTGPNNYTHTSVLMYTHHIHTQGSTHNIFSHHPFPFSRPVLYVQGHALVVKIGLLFWGPLVHIQGHLHWSQQLHPHISADVHTSLTPRGSTHTFFSHHPFPFSRPVLYVQGHALVVKIGLLFWGPLVHIQGHLHWSQQLHPHISADVHTSLTPREALTHFFTPPLPFQQACLVRTRGTHW